MHSLKMTCLKILLKCYFWFLRHNMLMIYKYNLPSIDQQTLFDFVAMQVQQQFWSTVYMRNQTNTFRLNSSLTMFNERFLMALDTLQVKAGLLSFEKWKWPVSQSIQCINFNHWSLYNDNIATDRVIKITRSCFHLTSPLLNPQVLHALNLSS